MGTIIVATRADTNDDLSVSVLARSLENQTSPRGDIDEKPLGFCFVWLIGAHAILAAIGCVIT